MGVAKAAYGRRCLSSPSKAKARKETDQGVSETCLVIFLAGLNRGGVCGSVVVGG